MKCPCHRHHYDKRASLQRFSMPRPWNVRNFQYFQTIFIWPTSHFCNNCILYPLAKLNFELGEHWQRLEKKYKWGLIIKDFVTPKIEIAYNIGCWCNWGVDEVSEYASILPQKIHSYGFWKEDNCSLVAPKYDQPRNNTSICKGNVENTNAPNSLNGFLST